MPGDATRWKPNAVSPDERAATSAMQPMVSLQPSRNSQQGDLQILTLCKLPSTPADTLRSLAASTAPCSRQQGPPARARRPIRRRPAPRPLLHPAPHSRSLARPQAGRGCRPNVSSAQWAGPARGQRPCAGASHGLAVKSQRVAAGHDAAARDRSELPSLRSATSGKHTAAGLVGSRCVPLSLEPARRLGACAPSGPDLHDARHWPRKRPGE